MMYIVFIICAILCIQESMSFKMGTSMKSMKSNTAMNLFKAGEKRAPSTKPKVEAMGRGDLLTKLQAITAFKKKDIELVLDSFISIVHDDVLHKGVQLRLRDFGTFKQSKRAPKKGRNPLSGEAIDIAGRTTVTFTGAKGSFNLID